MLQQCTEKKLSRIKLFLGVCKVAFSNNHEVLCSRFLNFLRANSQKLFQIISLSLSAEKSLLKRKYIFYVQPVFSLKGLLRILFASQKTNILTQLWYLHLLSPSIYRIREIVIVSLAVAEAEDTRLLKLNVGREMKHNRHCPGRPDRKELTKFLCCENVEGSLMLPYLLYIICIRNLRILSFHV